MLDVLTGATYGCMFQRATTEQHNADVGLLLLIHMAFFQSMHPNVLMPQLQLLPAINWIVRSFPDLPLRHHNNVAHSMIRA